jgi:hypothetical protein
VSGKRRPAGEYRFDEKFPRAHRSHVARGATTGLMHCDSIAECKQKDRLAAVSQIYDGALY